MSKFFKKKIIIPLVTLPIIATSIGLGVHFSKNGSISNHRISDASEIKTILTNSNSDVPTDLKQYLLSVVNQIDENKEIDIKKVADTLKKWAQINDYLSKIKKTNFSQNYTNFLQQSLNLSVTSIESQKNSLEKDIDKNDATGLHQLISKSDEISQIEQSLSNFYTNGKKFEQDYKQIQDILDNPKTALSQSSRKNLELNLINDFSKNQNLKDFLNKVSKIESLAQQIVAKQGLSSSKDKIDIDDLSTLENSQNPNVGELKQLVSNLDLKSSSTLKEIQKTKNDAKLKINNLTSLSFEFKDAFKQKVNDTDDLNAITSFVNLASQYNDVASKLIDLVQMSENIKTTSQYNLATNKTNFDNIFNKAQNALNSDLKLNLNNNYFLEAQTTISNLEATILDLKTALANLNGQANNQKISDFKAEVEQKLKVDFHPGVNKYDLKKLIYSANVDTETKPFLLTENDIDGVKLVFLNSKLDDNNINQIHLIYQATKISNPKITAQIDKTMTFDNDFNDVIAKIQFSTLDKLFEIDYDRLASYSSSQFELKKAEIESSFVNKLNNVDGFFTYKIKKGSLTKTNDKKISLSVDFFVNQKQVKELTLESAKSISFKTSEPEADYFRVSIEPSEQFKNSLYYKEPDKWLRENRNSFSNQSQKNLFDKWFVATIFKPLENLVKSNKFGNKTLASSISSFYSNKNAKNLTINEVKDVFNQLLNDNAKDIIKNLFDIEKPEDVQLSFKNWSQQNDNSIQFYNVDSKVPTDAQFKFEVQKNGQTKEMVVKIPTWANDKRDLDYDLAKALSYIEHKNTNPDLDAELIWDHTTFKDGATKSHSDYKASDAIEALTDSYNFPKIGDYQIYPKSLIWYRNFVNSNTGALANVFFWIKKDGQDVKFEDIKSNLENFEEYQNKFAKKINYFEPQYYTDIKTQNRNKWFEVADFSSNQDHKDIDNADKAIIDKINSTNFELRKADGAIINKKATKYSLLDPKDIVDQHAFAALNYLLKLKSNTLTKNSPDVKSSEEQQAQKAAEANHDNAEFKDKDQVKDGLKDSKGNIIEQNSNLVANNNDFYKSTGNISVNGDVSNNIDVSRITKKYFIYFYDVQLVNNKPDSISFKLGFIDKNNTNKRYTNASKTITLTNLRNDFKYNLYPQIILNQIKLSDFTINNPTNLTTAQQIQNQIHWLKTTINYNNFDFYTNKIQVADVVVQNNEQRQGLYIKFKYTDPTTHKTVIGNNWYKIADASSNTFFKKEFSFENPNLQTIFNSRDSIERTRKLEFYFKDQSWSYNSSDQSAHWVLKEKYLDKTFLKNNSVKRKIKLTILGDTLIQDDFRLSRFINRQAIIGDYSKPYTVEIDFDKLMSQKSQTVSFTTHPYSINTKKQAPALKLDLIATLSAQNDIDFTLRLEESSNKLIVGNPYFYTLATPVIYANNSARYGEFDKNKAFILNYYGASVEISYTNSLEHEEFNTGALETNQFNYNELDFSQENQPISFYTPESILNSDEYNPNQNVNYELHNGYLMDQQYIHKGWKTNELVREARAREFAFSFGSGTELAKVSNDPKDLRFYAISNRHIVKVDNWNDLRTQVGYQGRNYFTKPSSRFQNDVEAGFSYWGGAEVGNNMKLQVIWTGINQTNKDGKTSEAGRENIDATVFSFDANIMIDQARKLGKMGLIKWFEDLAKLPDVKFNTSWEKQGISLNSDVRKYAIIGFPYGKQAGYYLNRIKNAQATTSLSHINNYVQTFYNAGNSGTGILGDGHEYIATINSGIPLTGLQGWKYDTPEYNYFGVNFNGQHPLDLKNTYSLSAEILRRHLEHPLDYKLPWFLNNFKGYTKK